MAIDRKKTIGVTVLTLSSVASIGLSACEEPLEGSADVSAAETVSAIEEIRQRVLKRCGLSSTLAENKLPWYFFYEFGVELLDAGQAWQALESFQMTANLRPESARGARMYGMWFVNYLPYYRLSMAYAELGEWELAWESIQLSEAMIEFSPDDFDYEDFRLLKEKIGEEREAAG